MSPRAGAAKERPPLEVQLLGTLEFRSASGRAIKLSGRKDRALLAYLAARAGVRHSRDAIAALLWGDVGDVQARASLRHALSILRRELGDHADALIVESSDVMLDAHAVETDLAAFERGVTGAPRDLGALTALYRGEFLAGFAVPERAFEDWLRTERERLRTLALEALERWLTASMEANRHEAALEAGRRALAIDPVRESVHRALMRVHDRRGERAAVARQYQSCVDVLKAELAAAPAPETTALYRQLMSGAAPTASPARAPEAPRRTKPAPARARRAGPPLVGRDAEMARLRTICDGALAGAGRVLAVVGEAGIGKTRLVDELVAPLRAGHAARVVTGHCYANDTAFALSAWIDALRSVVGEEPLLASVGAPWRSELGVLVPELGVEAIPGASAGPRRLFEAVGRLVDRLAALSPLVLVLEDLHWADDATVRLFTFVARRIAELPVLIIVTARDEEPEYRERLETITTELGRAGLLDREILGPLSRHDANTLVRALRRERNEADDAGMLETVWRTSEGNPLALLEAVRAVTDGAPQATSAGTAVPEVVRGLIRERLRRVPEHARRVLDVAAVIGRTFELRLLAQASGFSEAALLDQLRDLVQRRILDDRADGVDFCHDRIREVTYEAVTPSARRALHATVAGAIESLYAGREDEHAHALAVHWRQAQAWDRAVAFFCRAGGLAARRGAPREALHCFDEAMTALERMPETAERVALEIDVRLGSGQVLIPLDDRERLAQYVIEADMLCERLEDPRRLGSVLALNTRHAINWSDPTLVLAAAERGHAVATKHGDPEQRGDAAYLLSLASYFVGDARRSVALARHVIEQGLDETRPGAVFTAPRQILVRAVLGQSLAELGELDEAAQAADHAVALASGRRGPYPLIVALVAQGTVYLLRDDPARAVTAFTRAVELGREAGYTQFDIPARAGAAIGRARQDQVRDAVAALEELMAELPATNSRLWITWPALWLGEAYLRAGRAVDARTQAESTLRQARTRGERSIEGWTLCLLGEIAGSPDTLAPADGLAAYAAAVEIAEAGGLRPLAAHCALGAARLHARAGRDDVAGTALARARELFAALRLSVADRDLSPHA